MLKSQDIEKTKFNLLCLLLLNIWLCAKIKLIAALIAGLKALITFKTRCDNLELFCVLDSYLYEYGKSIKINITVYRNFMEDEKKLLFFFKLVLRICFRLLFFFCLLLCTFFPCATWLYIATTQNIERNIFCLLCTAISLRANWE